MVTNSGAKGGMVTARGRAVSSAIARAAHRQNAETAFSCGPSHRHITNCIKWDDRPRISFQMNKTPVSLNGDNLTLAKFQPCASMELSG